MPSVTRRRLLGGAAVAAGALGTYRLGSGAPNATFDPWTPAQGTWPLPRYDASNTACNPRASPPREDPTRRIRASVDGEQSHVRPLVGDSRIVLYGSTLAASARDSGSVATIADAQVEFTGIGPDGRIHAVQKTGRPRYTVVGYDGTTEAYRTPLDGGHPAGLTVGRSEVVVGGPTRELVAIEPDGRTWRVGGMTAALAGGRLYAVGAPDGVVAYAERSGLGRRLSAGPKRTWTARRVHGRPRAPAVADGRLVVGAVGGPSTSGTVAAYDTETGERLWAPRELGGLVVSTPAVSGDRGYVTVSSDGPGPTRVLALDLDAGETLWTDETGWDVHTPVVGGETLLVLGAVSDGDELSAGKVRAYDTASGEVLWTVTFEGTVPNRDGVALVGDRALVTAGSILYELV